MENLREILFGKISNIIDYDIETEEDQYSRDEDGNNPSISISYDSKNKASENILKSLNIDKSKKALVQIKEFVENGGVLKEGREIFIYSNRKGYCKYLKYDKKQKKHYLTEHIEHIVFDKIVIYKELQLSDLYVEIDVLPVYL